MISLLQKGLPAEDNSISCDVGSELCEPGTPFLQRGHKLWKQLVFVLMHF